MADVDVYTDPRIYSMILAPQFKELNMPKFIDRTGARYGRLTVQSRAGRSVSKKTIWSCLCDCGQVTLVDSCSLVTGNTVSCGCFLKEKITKHGGWKKGSYNTWRAMMRRCTNPADKDYKRYGAVGVVVCQEWHDYLRFAADMGEPIGTQTLDRIDAYGNYTKENCRWASVSTQNRNTRVRKTSKSGYVGVHLRSGKWYAEVTSQKKKYYSKAYATVEEAAAARKELERLHWSVC